MSGTFYVSNGLEPVSESSAQDVRLTAALNRLVTHAMSSRMDWLRAQDDSRRDVEGECGYPPWSQYMDPSYLRQLYDRHPIARRAVQVLPRECWQVTPQVYETEDSDEPTAFEQAWDALGEMLCPVKSWHRQEQGSRVWSYLKRADELAGIGHFGVILLGVNDGGKLNEPLDGVEESVQSPAKGSDGNGKPSGGAWDQYFSWNTRDRGNGRRKPTANAKSKSKADRRLLFMRPFDESLVQVARYEEGDNSPRFGQPLEYTITLNDPKVGQQGTGMSTATAQVHWTRVIHVADNLGASEVFGDPRLQPILDPVLGMRKIYGAAPEGYWKSCFNLLSLETHPSLGGDVAVNDEKLKQMIDAVYNGLDRAFRLKGMTAKSIAPSVVDPTPHVKLLIEAVCILLGVPVRVFMGSERGELASSQDDASWNDRLRERQNNYLTPYLVAALIDRLIACSVLPEPGEGYCIEWPDLDSVGKKDKASIGLARTQALSAYVSGGCEAVVPREHWFTNFMEFTDEESEAMVQAADDLKEERQQEADAVAKEQGLEPVPPEGYKAPEPAPQPIKVRDGETLVNPNDVGGQ